MVHIYSLNKNISVDTAFYNHKEYEAWEKAQTHRQLF